MNNLVKNAAASSLVDNSGTAPHSIPMSKSPHLLSQSQLQTQGASHFRGHFQLSEPQVQVSAQAQYPQAHARVQSQAPHPQFQAHPQPQTQPVVAPLHNSNTNTANMTPSSVSTSRPAGSSKTMPSSPFKTRELTPAVRQKELKLLGKQVQERWH